MKKGASFFSFAEDVDLKEAMSQMAKAGYDGVELVLGSTGEITMDTSEKDLNRIKAMAEDFGLEIPSLGTWLLWENNIVSPDAKEREYCRVILRRMLDTAAALGADTILAIPGYCGSDFVSGKPLVSYDDAYERAKETFCMVAEHAEKVKVSIGLENVWNKFLLSPLEMRSIIDEADSDYVGAYFDVGNIMYIGYPQHWIEILGSRIKKIHFCDYRCSQAGLGAFVDLMAGDVPFKEVMKSLRKVGYDDYITYEMLPNYADYPYQSLISGIHSLNVILSEA
ncbi:MAG: sugar phosphate isomerase/epimerase family protein [Caldicoprobacterales bacterium]|jgi:L-ribulose-5-phosphate 3-epimerase